MTILVIDGQGGAIGSQMVKRLLAELPQTEILAVGTNSIATASMLKSGAIHASTGENAVMTCAKRADIIVGPIGIVLADALMGEVTPKMAKAVGRAKASRVLIPVSKCDTLIAGVSTVPMSVLIEDAMGKIRTLLGNPVNV